MTDGQRRPHPKGLIFDKDGTLFDFEATWTAATLSLIDTLSDGDPALRRVIGEALAFDLEAGRLTAGSVLVAGTTRETATVLLGVLPARWDLGRIVSCMERIAAMASQVEAVPLRPTLSDLARRGYLLGLVTNDSERPARRHLEEAGIADLMAFVAGSDSGHGAKPGPGQLLAFSKVVDLDPSDVVMVGDSRYDLLAGRAAGMRTVGVLTGVAPDAELRPLADAVLPDIGALPAWLDAL